MIEDENADFVFYSGFRKWPGFMLKSGMLPQDFDPETFAHVEYSNIFAPGSLMVHGASLNEKRDLIYVAQYNFLQKVIFYF